VTAADHRRAALVVPPFGACGPLEVSAYLDALGRYPWLSLLLVGRDSERALAETLQSGHEQRVDYLELCSGVSESFAIQQGMQTALARDHDFVGYWAADCEAPLCFVDEWARLLSEDAEKLLVFGARLRLVQHEHPGLWWRHYAGRALASAVSLTLDLRAYDIDCCAKLFRNTPQVRAVFAEPFFTRVAYDAEVFARLVRDQAQFSMPIERSCVEFPLTRWRRRPRPRYGPASLHKLARDLLKVRRFVNAAQTNR
jgi:dolichyl-phosphate beta-glucosyltransferase